MDETGVNNANEYMDSRYPNAIRLRDATYKYNCHSYAWYSTSVTNRWWMEDPTLYMTDGSYYEVGPYPTASGQRMYYPLPEYEHSAIVVTPSTDIFSIRVKSKWGRYGLYEHDADHCPYFVGGALYSYWQKFYL